VTGRTSSSNFPTTSPIDGALGGSIDVFVTKINPAGSAHVYSTYLGGNGIEEGFGIAVDSSGSAYVTGETQSADFPTTSPIQGTFGGNQDAFVTKINPAGSAHVYSTYLGGVSQDIGRGIAVDSSGSAYVTGNTVSSDFPTANPIDGALAGGGDAFVTKIGELQIIGGTIIPIDTTSLLLVGAQSTASWMIPVIIAGVGIAIVITRKF